MAGVSRGRLILDLLARVRGWYRRWL